MGFFKKIAKGVAKIATAPMRPVVSSTKKILEVTGGDRVFKSVGIDTTNLSNQMNSVLKGDIQTGDAQFKNAAFDAAKIAISASGIGGAISGTTAAAGFAVATKAQAGGGVTLGDLGSLAGLPTNIGGVDLGGIGIVNPKPTITAPVSSVWPDYLGPSYTGAQTTNNSSLIMIGIFIISIFGLLFIFMRKK